MNRRGFSDVGTLYASSQKNIFAAGSSTATSENVFASGFDSVRWYVEAEEAYVMWATNQAMLSHGRLIGRFSKVNKVKG